ncbi:MAG: tetratricopeptide repeat protein [Candidatus Latescibacteria bacterium]|nr:tetratricopeptide repeat protein [Candidatus Latescibacterota bacterium]
MISIANRPYTLIVALGLVAVVYARSIPNGFCFDDHAIVAENPQVIQARWGEIFTSDYWSTTGEHTGLYRPLTLASFALNFLLAGEGAWSFHLVNLVLHLGATALFYWVVAACLSPGAALLAGLCFGLHPALTEAVAGVVGRAELLSCCLGLTGVWTWRAAKVPAQYLGALALLSLAPLAKESGICFPLGAAVWALCFQPSKLAAWIGALAAAGLSLGIKLLVLGQLQPGDIGFLDNPLAYVSAPVRMLNSPGLLVHYLKLLVFPWPLSADYSFNQLPVAAAPDAEVLGALGLVLSLGFLLWRALRRQPDLALWVLVGGSALVLVANLLLAGGTLFAERLLYLPALAFSLGVGWAAEQLDTRKTAVLIGGWVLVAAPLVWQRCGDWQDDLHLFRRAVEVTPASARSHYGLGRALQESGDAAGALAVYTTALAIFPRYAEAHFNRGAALLSLDRPSEALAEYRQAVQIRPGFTKALYAVAVLTRELEGDSAAIPAFLALLTQDPGHAAGVEGFCAILLRQGERARAVEVVEHALAANPGNAELARVQRLLPVTRAVGPGTATDPGQHRTP